MSEELLNLESKTCPETFLYTKLALEQCQSGKLLKVKFADKSTADKVRSSLILEGILANCKPEQDSSKYLLEIVAP